MQPFTPDRLPNTRLDHSAPELIAALAVANRAIAKYDAQLAQSPGAHLLLAPMVQREAMLSSRIEGSQSTLGEVMEFEEDEAGAGQGERRDDLNEIRNYVAALQLGEAALHERHFSASLLKELHAVLLGRSVRGQSKQPGAYRTGQVWIGRHGAGIERASYIPPAPWLVAELMDNWAEYYRGDAPDALAQAAILHAQFELIHPFADGNGRLGRLLIPLFLFEKKVISRPVFYPSSYLEKHRDAYMGALARLNVLPGDWQEWTLFFLHAVSEQAAETSQIFGELAAVYARLKREFVALSHSQFAVPVLDAMFARPLFGKRGMRKMLAARVATPPSAATLHNLLMRLVKHGALRVVRPGRGRRSTLYALSEVVEILDA